MRLTLDRAGVVVAVGVLLAVPALRAQQAQTPADIVLINGTVLTVDRNDSEAQALAIRDGKIAAVGTTDAIKALAGASTEIIDLRGRAVTPGLIDSHVHFSAADALFTVDLGS